MSWRKVVVALIVASCCTVGGLYWHLTRPIPIVPPTAAIYDGAYEGGHYQVTRFSDDSTHRIVVSLFSAARNKPPGVYHLKFPHDAWILTSQFDTPLERYRPNRGSIDYLLRLFRRNQSRNKVAQWLSESGDVVVTVHTPPGADGRQSISVELMDVVLRKEGSRMPNKTDSAGQGPDRCKIKLLMLGPVEFGK